MRSLLSYNQLIIIVAKNDDPTTLRIGNILFVIFLFYFILKGEENKICIS